MPEGRLASRPDRTACALDGRLFMTEIGAIHLTLIPQMIAGKTDEPPPSIGFARQ